ncbi:MAG: class I SAM-dependent RNA methyltransferase [Chloroflexota bacterium]
MDEQHKRLVFTDMAYGGDAVGRDPESGVAVFAWPGITGEDATVSITQRGKNLLRGVVTELHTLSPSRTTPPCPYFGSCGGCQWQHISYEAQVEFKHNILRSQLQRSAGIADPDAVLRPPLGSPNSYNYRNTSHFSIDPVTKSLGYFRRDSHEVIPVLECPISAAGINQAIPAVNSMLADALDPAVLVAETRGAMRVWKVSIRTSETTGQTVVVFHSKAGGRSEPRPGRGARRQNYHPVQRPDIGPDMDAQPDANPVVVLSRRNVRHAIGALSRPASGEPIPLLVVEVMDDGTVNRLGETRSSSSAASEAIADTLSGVSLAGSLARSTGAGGAPLGAWIERLGGFTYWVGPESFFQVNTPAAELLLAEVAAHLPEKVGMLVDAHAGVGTFALAFAKRAKRIIGFEMDSGAVSSARWTAHAHNAENIEFRQGKAEALIRTLSEAETPDAVILDPPRAGCHPNLLNEIARRKVPQIIYVSCDPSTLARDIKLLAPNYTLTSARMIDMFPQTYHLETVAVLGRNA